MHLLNRQMDLDVLELLEVLKDLVVQEDLEVMVIKEEPEVQETQMGTRGDQDRRGVLTLRQSSTQIAGHHLRHHPGRQIIEVSGTS